MRHVEIARSLIGVPWVHQGRDPARGIDCAGLLEIAYEIGESNFSAGYSRHPHSDLIAKHMAASLGAVVDDEPRAGDAVTIGFGVNGVVRHVAIVADYVHGGLSIIHTDSVIGRVVEQPINDKWLRRIRGVYRRQETTA